MNFAQKKLVVNGSMSSDVSSEWVLIDQLAGFALQCVYSGTPNGTLSVLVSCDPVASPDDVVNFDTLASSSVAISASGVTTYNVNNQYYKWFKVYFDYTSGSGSLNVAYNGKG
jgi:hypothetical protein